MRSSELPQEMWQPEKRVVKPKKFGAEFYSGKELEADLFGTMDTSNPKYQESYRAVANEKGYATRAKSIELVKKFQSQDPTNPSKEFLRELRNSLTEILSLFNEEEMDRVKAYTAVGSPYPTSLDIYHGIDSFITYEENGREYMVTLDASHRKKDEQVKADIVVGEMPDPQEEQDNFLDMVNEAAKKVVRNIARQRERTGEKSIPYILPKK